MLPSAAVETGEQSRSICKVTFTRNPKRLLVGHRPTRCAAAFMSEDLFVKLFVLAILCGILHFLEKIARL
jgi:hypothetical protein